MDSKDQQDGIGGFSQKVLRYFLTFLQTDFKRQQAPRRRIQLKSDAGFRMGMPLRKYVTLYNAIWKFAGSAPEGGLQFRVAPKKYTSPISPTLRDLIRQQVEAIPSDEVTKIAGNTIQFADSHRQKAVNNPEKFVESVQVHLVEEVGTRIVQPLLAMLEGPFKEASYSAIESIYDVEADLTDAIAARPLENLPTPVNTLIVTGNQVPMSEMFEELFEVADVRSRIQGFFDDFATSDAFQELRDLQHALRSAENQSLYLYLCEIRFGPHAFPLFYVPATLEYQEDAREFLIEFDPHLLINKQAVDWILQEKAGEAATVPLSPIKDRILFLNGQRSFIDEMDGVLSGLIPSLELAADIDLRVPKLQQASSPTSKLANTAYFAIFDKADEALINDYEELLAAFNVEQQGAGRLFENIIKGFIFDNPVSVQGSVDAQWDTLGIHERLVADSPLPVNEEQRKILSAIRNPDCNYISVQGPPGTGKSHTITAIAFDAILNGSSVLVLSDKTEALDVVQDKLESVLSKVRHGDDDFPNPILRLGKTGGTYNRLVSASAKTKIKTHYDAAKAHAGRLESETQSTMSSLQADIGTTVSILSEITLPQLNELHHLEHEIELLRPGFINRLQNPSNEQLLPELSTLAAKLKEAFPRDVIARIAQEEGCVSLQSALPRLAAWQVASGLGAGVAPRQSLAIFSTLDADHHKALLNFIFDYEGLRMPLFGYLFRGRKVQALNMRVGAELPCPDPIDLHRRLPEMKQVARTVGQVRDALSKVKLEHRTGFVYQLLLEGIADTTGVNDLATFASKASLVMSGSDDDLRCGEGRLGSLEAVFELAIMAARYTSMWKSMAARMERIPKTDYVGTKTRLEQLNTARMTREIDRRFIDFVENKKATVKEIGGVIKGKQKFPEDEFHHLSDAFPVIIAGIREYAEYVPLKTKMFDLVVIDEASQVSVAQALPAILRAKKVVVFGDQKQFSNVKSANASNTINAGYITDIEAYFRANISDASTKIERLKHFDVKRSILEFFDLITNYQTMLRKHFRGYQELISFSSKNFYDGQLQAIKIRSMPVNEVIRFKEITPEAKDGAKNTNRAEAEFILQEMRRMLDEGDVRTVGVITPFREQLKVLNDLLYRDAYGERFETEQRLKIMTFDTCQGEERDLIIYSMVATPERDALNYIFPVSIEGIQDKVEEALKVQRLNVGFSRAKEGMLFVISKPADQFKGSIGRVMAHYKAILEDRSKPDESDVDPSSPMEKKVLDWIYKTSFVQLNEERIEVVPQFPIGEYLRQLDPFYSHPAYRCDFLLRYYNDVGTVNVIIEYDGFAEHFVEHKKIHNGNWDKYYRPEDVERQMVIESYGYKFLRINRFNLGADPIEVLSKRLYDLIEAGNTEEDDALLVKEIKGDAESLEDGTKKRCPKCGEIRDRERFWDKSLKSGNGGYGRNCMTCKAPSVKPAQKSKFKGWHSKYGHRY
jgi:hypothetical protein